MQPRPNGEISRLSLPSIRLFMAGSPKMTTLWLLARYRQTYQSKSIVARAALRNCLGNPRYADRYDRDIDRTHLTAHYQSDANVLSIGRHGGQEIYCMPKSKPKSYVAQITKLLRDRDLH